MSTGSITSLELCLAFLYVYCKAYTTLQTPGEKVPTHVLTEIVTVRVVVEYTGISIAKPSTKVSLDAYDKLIPLLLSKTMS